MSDDGMLSTPETGLPRRPLLAAALAAAISAMTSCGTGHDEQRKLLASDRMWGVFLPTSTRASPTAVNAIDRLASLAGTKPHFVHIFAAMTDSLPVESLDGVNGVGATPILTLEPWRPFDGRVQPAYSLASIAAGRHDSDLSRWATQLAAWPHPVLLRFAQEMNGTWYPWSVGVNGNTAADYRSAWTRMYSIVSEQAPQVRFVWAPNAVTEGTRDFTDCYPGDDVVDYLGLDGYNWGKSPGHLWQSPEKLFSASLEALRKLSPNRPTLITEVGCADGATPNLKAEWIADFFRVIERAPSVLGFVWFQMDKERDWRFNSTPASTRSFRDGLAKWMRSG
ncbi:glycoside hydrolase family 26 protein [Gordonia rubripertincta]|uniref:glycoside hydrolase family 26 protein n=1 Tax=Gordonia rubripertincta TaxID=36822 RepID=UPI001FD3E9A3|nr:glycosyl hydrolase [Gordonia rubripertincta]